MITSEMFETMKRNISLIIDSLDYLINNPDTDISKTDYWTHEVERKNFIIYLYVYKLIINGEDYLTLRYNNYVNRIKRRKSIDLKHITNIDVDSELDLLFYLRKKLLKEFYYYNSNDNTVYFNDDTWFDTKWFLTVLTLIIDNKRIQNKEINISYAIPKLNIEHFNDDTEVDSYLSNYTYYNIKIKSNTNNYSYLSMVEVKNRALNYLKCLKKFNYGKCSAESYQKIYDDLIDKCSLLGFSIEETKNSLNDLSNIDYIKEKIDEKFCDLNISNQIMIIENTIWQLSEDYDSFEYINNCIDMLIDFLTNLRINNNTNYLNIKKRHNYSDENLLIVLATSKFLLTYKNICSNLDYSLIDLNNINPKYMSIISDENIKEIKMKINNYINSLNRSKKNMIKYKEERSKLNKVVLGRIEYQKELENCVSKINRSSIDIAFYNSKISMLTKEYEEVKNDCQKKYHDAKKYTYNNSLIDHIRNSIIGCNFYMKDNNDKLLYDKIIVFEDLLTNDNSFYLEITFKDLMKVSNLCLINSLSDQLDLPKLIE